MDNQVVIISARREGYGIDQISYTMTIGELIECLEQYDEDSPVYLSHDNGYTYGGITWDRVYDKEIGQEDEEQ